MFLDRLKHGEVQSGDPGSLVSLVPCFPVGVGERGVFPHLPNEEAPGKVPETACGGDVTPTVCLGVQRGQLLSVVHLPSEGPTVCSSGHRLTTT